MLQTPPSLPKVLILHAYSPSNLGDKLLIDLAMEQVQIALGDCDFRIICSDASGFDDTNYLQWRSPIAKYIPIGFRRVQMILTLIFGAHRNIVGLSSGADLVVAVGGGYLRGGHAVEIIKSAGAHLGQLRLAARYGHKVIYLPQSIGPHRGLYYMITKRYLSKLQHVFVRDQRSFSDLRALANVTRMPDLAVLKLAQETPKSLRTKDRARPLHNRPILVVRELRRPRTYHDFLQQAAVGNKFEWAIQSSGGGNDDGPLTRRHSTQTPRFMPEVLAESEKRIVVSTRLHGALSSLIAGFPAIHLSYERKGWGAFEDIGLEDFVLNARDASLSDVEHLIDEIKANEGAYWKKISQSQGEISEHQEYLTRAIRTTLDYSRNTSH